MRDCRLGNMLLPAQYEITEVCTSRGANQVAARAIKRHSVSGNRLQGRTSICSCCRARNRVHSTRSMCSLPAMWPLWLALYKDTIDHWVALTTQRDRQRGASEKSLDSVSAKGANWVGRNAIARRSALIEISVDGTLLERPILRSGSGRRNEMCASIP